MTMTPQQEQNMRVLEYVYDNDEGSAGPAGLSGLRELVGEDNAADSAVELQRVGWIRRDERLSGGYHVTALGRSEVETLRGRRVDRGHRRAACLEAFLRWVDVQTTTDAGSRVSREKFDGSADLMAFSEDESRAAATTLEEKGLIKTISAMGAPHTLVWITDAGRECVDQGGVAAYLRSQRPGAGDTVHNYNMGGTGNVFATATAPGAVANATLNNFNPTQARLFAAAVRSAQDELVLDGLAIAALTEIEAVDAEPERAHRATRVLTEFLMGTTTGTIGQVLGMIGASALGLSG